MARYTRAAVKAVTDSTATSITIDMEADLVNPADDPVEPVLAGRLLLAEFRSVNAPVAPDGWTQLGDTLDETTGDSDAEGGRANHSLWYRIADEGEANTYTFEEEAAAPNGIMALGISVYSDVDTSLMTVQGVANADQPTDRTQIFAPTGIQGDHWPSGSLAVSLWAAARASVFGSPVPMKIVRNIPHNPGNVYNVVTPRISGQQCMTALVSGASTARSGRPATAIDQSTGETLGDGATPVETGRRNAFTVLLPSAPLIPRNLHADTVSDSEIDIGWDAFQSGVNYRLRRDGAVIYDGPDTSFQDTGLDPSTTYQYDAQAYSDSMESAWSPVVSATTLPEDAPQPPSSPEAVTISSSEIDVSWDEEPDVDGYRVQYGTEPFEAGAGEQVYDGNIPDFPHSGLQPSTTYYYRIQAYRGAVDGGWTALVQATTDDSKGNGDCGCPGDLPWPPDTSHFTPLPYVTTAEAERELEGEDS